MITPWIRKVLISPAIIVVPDNLKKYNGYIIFIKSLYGGCNLIVLSLTDSHT